MGLTFAECVTSKIIHLIMHSIRIDDPYVYEPQIINALIRIAVVGTLIQPAVDNRMLTSARMLRKRGAAAVSCLSRQVSGAS